MSHACHVEVSSSTYSLCRTSKQHLKLRTSRSPERPQTPPSHAYSKSAVVPLAVMRVSLHNNFPQVALIACPLPRAWSLQHRVCEKPVQKKPARTKKVSSVAGIRSCLLASSRPDSGPAVKEVIDKERSRISARRLCLIPAVCSKTIRKSHRAV